MFDLFRSRDTAVRVVLGGLLLLVALSMLLYLIPGAGMSTTSNSGGEVVAEVGNQKITTRDVQELVQERMRSRQVPPEMMQFLLPQLIEQQIADRAIAFEARRMGFQVTDADLARILRGLPNIGSLPADQYRMAIESMGMTVPQFETNMRDGQYALRLQDLALAGVVVTPAEIQEEYGRRNEKIKLDYIAFDPNKLKAEVKPTPQQLQTYFASMRSAFSIPETRSFGLVVIDPQAVSATMQVSDAQMQSYYNSHKEDFRTPERVRGRHILLMTTGKSDAEKAKIKAQAEDLLKQIKGGGNFAELAKKYSEDPGSKDKGGELGWFVRGQMVKNFEDTAFSLKPGQLSDVITTEYGYHIIQVEEKQGAHLQTFDEVKGQIADAIKKGSLNDRVQNLGDQARAEIAKNPAAAEQVAQKLGLIFVKADKIKAGDPLPLLGADKGVSDTLFTMKKGDVSPVLQANNKLGIAVLDAVNPARQAEFAEVEPQVRDRYQTDQAAKIGIDRAHQAAEMLKSNGGDLQAVAKKFGVEVKNTGFFTRQGAAEGVGSANYFLDIFPKPIGSITGAVNVGTQTVVAKLVEKQEPDPAKLGGERDAILAQLKNKKAEERSQLFQDSIMNKLIQEHKVKVHKDVINHILAQNRTS